MPDTRVAKIEANKVVDGRLIRNVGKVIVKHQAWVLNDKLFMGAGIEGIGFQAYIHCHGLDKKTYGEVRLEIVVDGVRSARVLEGQLATHHWKETQVKGCIELVHDILEALVPNKLIMPDYIVDAIHDELRYRKEEGLDPFPRK